MTNDHYLRSSSRLRSGAAAHHHARHRRVACRDRPEHVV